MDGICLHPTQQLSTKNRYLLPQLVSTDGEDDPDEETLW